MPKFPSSTPTQHRFTQTPVDQSELRHAKTQCPVAYINCDVNPDIPSFGLINSDKGKHKKKRNRTPQTTTALLQNPEITISATPHIDTQNEERRKHRNKQHNPQKDTGTNQQVISSRQQTGDHSETTDRNKYTSHKLTSKACYPEKPKNNNDATPTTKNTEKKQGGITQRKHIKKPFLPLESKTIKKNNFGKPNSDTDSSDDAAAPVMGKSNVTPVQRGGVVSKGAVGGSASKSGSAALVGVGGVSKSGAKRASESSLFSNSGSDTLSSAAISLSSSFFPISGGKRVASPLSDVPSKRCAFSSGQHASSRSSAPCALNSSGASAPHSSSICNDHSVQNGSQDPIPNIDSRGRLSAPFRRVDGDTSALHPRLSDNSFRAKPNSRGAWGERAERDFAFTAGKSFRHEKTKKKRGTYQGGAISTAVSSFKFDD